jgi:two-component system NtrC family sensor kinase
LILGISYWVIGRVTGPVKHLSETVASFADGHFGKTVSTNREDEIGKLIAGFNMMAEKLKKAYKELEGKVEASNKELEIAYQMLKQRQEQLIRSEKMAALGQLSAGIAHEIRNPLTSFKIFIQSLEKEIDLDDNRKEDFRIIMKEIDRINENIARFLNFARPEEPLFQAIRVSSLVKDTVNLLAAKLKSSGIRLDISLPDEDPPVEGDPKQLTQVFLNLLLNAVEAMPQGGTLTISSVVKVNPDTLQESFQLVIKDTGQGIPEKDQPYLFDPFFTTKAGGTGLGLSIVYSIIQKHNGRIEVESELGKGSSFILSLPIQKEGAWRAFSS